MIKYNFADKSIRGLSSKDTPASINERLEWLRCVLGYPPNTLASRIGSSKYAVINVLGEKNDDPSVSMVRSLCLVFPLINQNWIWTGIGEPFLKDHTDYIFSNQPAVPDIDTEVNARLREVREDTGHTQALFAAEIGTTRDSIAFTEINKSNISIITAKNLIKKFNVNPDWFLFGAGPKYRKPKS